MAKSIKFESTVEVVTCMVCGKGGFTEDNPPVKYKGYTDHLKCFQKDFIKKFCKKHNLIKTETLEQVQNITRLPKLNAAWAALLVVDSHKNGKESVILYSDYKTKLESALADAFEKYTQVDVLGIFRKGQQITYKTVMTIHIVEEKPEPVLNKGETSEDASE